MTSVPQQRGSFASYVLQSDGDVAGACSFTYAGNVVQFYRLQVPW